MSVINVPEGYCGRILKKSGCPFAGLIAKDIKGNIVVCTTLTTISLVWIDKLTSVKNFDYFIKGELIVYVRNRNESIIKHLKTQKYTLRFLEEKDTEIFVPINGEVVLNPGEIGKVVHHPQEQILTDVRTIEKYFNIREKPRNFFIFKDIAWKDLLATELIVRLNVSIYKKEMFGALCKKLIEQSLLLMKDLDDLKAIIIPVAAALEGYLHDYDYNTLFQRNVMNIFNITSLEEDKTEEDKQFEITMKAKYDITTINLYIIKAPYSEFREQFMYEYKLLNKVFQRRKEYDLRERERTSAKERAIETNKKGLNLFKESKFEEASKLFEELFNIVVLLCDLSDRMISSVLYNLGKSKMAEKKNKDAITALETCFKLKGLQGMDTTSVKTLLLQLKE